MVQLEQVGLAYANQYAALHIMLDSCLQCSDKQKEEDNLRMTAMFFSFFPKINYISPETLS